MSKELDEIIEASLRAHSKTMHENIINAGAVLKTLMENMPEPPKLTRWERFTLTLRHMPGRFRDAWKVLKGDACIEEL